jgi:hypothetical protein
MGASVNVYWPGITEDQIESQPGFYNDDKPWGDWMAVREETPGALDAIRKLGAQAILSLKTDGWDDEDVTWVTPQQMRDAAIKLREAVAAGLPETQPILKAYEPSSLRDRPVAEQFIRDLDDVVTLTHWAEHEGASKMTLEVNW